MISKEEYLYFVNDALDAMAAMVEELGDDLANRRPDLAGANSPYAILTHCLGVMRYWAGAMVAGREIQRDRDAEFVASGPVTGLLEDLGSTRKAFETDVASAEPERPLRGSVPPQWSSHPEPHLHRQGAALMHVYEELAQHRGQMELSRDIIVATRSS